MTFHPPTSHTNDAFITDSNRWRALVQRNRAASSSFVYAVRSTNIYCRPTCPSRLARRANIVFYDTAADAEAAGFRACKRCKPGGAADEDPALDQGALVRRACEIVREEAERGETLGCAALAKKVGLSVRYFHGLFKRELGVTPQEYARKVAREVIIQRAGDGGDKEAVAGTEALQHTLPESLDINAPLLGSFDPFQVPLLNLDMDDGTNILDPRLPPPTDASNEASGSFYEKFAVASNSVAPEAVHSSANPIHDPSLELLAFGRAETICLDTYFPGFSGVGEWMLTDSLFEPLDLNIFSFDGRSQ